MSEKAITTVLEYLNESSGEIRGSAVVSGDGLTMASILPSDIDEDKIGAMAAAMASLGERVSEELNQGNPQQVLVRGSEGYLLLVRAGEEAVLATLAGKNAKLGLIFLDVKRAAKELEKII